MNGNVPDIRRFSACRCRPLLAEIYHMCRCIGMKVVIGVRVGVGTKRACGNRAVDIQHGTDMEGSAYPCTKG
jgi:hypothetical protein